MAINRDEFADLEPEFFIYPITWHQKTGKLSRFGQGELSFEDVALTGFIVFKAKDIQMSAQGDTVKSDGYVMFFNTHLEEVGILPNTGSDFFTYNGTKYEPLSVTKIGPASNNQFVLTRVDFKLK